MADADYATDIKKYSAAVNDKAVAGIVKYLGIALKSSRDAALVSCSSKSELERVRENYMKTLVSGIRSLIIIAVH